MELAKTRVQKLSVDVFFDVKTGSSFCWKYFGHLIVTECNKKKILNPEQVYCSACLTAVQNENEKVTFGFVKIKNYAKTVSTGNLIRHLRDDHQICGEVAGAMKAKTNVKDLVSTARSPKACTSTSETNKPKHDKWLLAKDLALWYCKSLLPFDSVSDEGMVDFFKKYNIIMTDDEIPSRFTVSGSALSDIYESMLSKVKDTISIDAATHLAMTFDLWTDRYRQLNYITITLHYLTSEFTLQALTLSTEIITGEKTEEKIYNVIKNIKKRFVLDGKNIVAVTDADESMKRAASLANMTHHLCLRQGLHNLVTVDGIQSVLEVALIIQKCKNIVKEVRYRAPELQTKAKKVKQQLEFLDSLDRIVESVEGDENNHILEIDLKFENTEDEISPSVLESGSRHIPTIKTTHWLSTLEMLESLIHVCNRDTINDMLGKIGQNELKITQTEWILLEDLLKFLESFRDAIQIMSSQKTCTMNVALVFRSEIIDILNTLKDNESLIMLRLKCNMLANINKRFPINKTIVAAALLDNRFMSLKEIDEYLVSHNMTRASFLSSYIREVITVDCEPETTTTTTSDDTATSLLHKLSKKHSTRAYQKKQEDPIEQECWRYIASADPEEPKDGNVLSYWNSKKNVFPHLSALAKAVLCVPATSTPSERMFSAAGLTISAKRSRLNPIRINKIIFIHDNYQTCKF